jgi:hypothetical protein
VTNYSNLFKQFLQEKQYIGGVTAGGINTFARSVNSFLSWLHREGHISEAPKRR